MEWLIPLSIGTIFTILGSLKCYGVLFRIQGGKDKPFTQQICGT
ncbi:MAG: hypothetical protein AABZ60_23610 [Planctomycetota bacterium]